MLFPRVNRESAEKIYTIIHNVDGDSISVGMGARYVGGAAAEIVSTDGIQAVKITGDAQMPQFAGIAKKDIPSDDYGIVQCWGYTDSVLLSAIADVTVGVTGIANSFLKVGAAAGQWASALAPQALSTMAGKFVQCWTTTNISGGLNYCAGFTRAL